MNLPITFTSLPVPYFFIAFVIFIAVLAHRRRRQTRSQQKANENFLEQERIANSTRKQDISELDYLHFDIDALPINEYPHESLTSCEIVLVELSMRKIINLSDYTNTQLKRMYGPANFKTLSACDDCYQILCEALHTYAERQLALDRTEAAAAILEYAVSLNLEYSNIYVLLAEIYDKQSEPEKIRRLIELLSGTDKKYAAAALKKLETFCVNEA